MKKIMVVAAVALAAVCTNAATLKWAISGVGIPTDTGAQDGDNLIVSSTANVGMYVYILDAAISGNVWDNYATLAGDHYTLNTDGAKQQGDASWKNAVATFTDGEHSFGKGDTGYSAAVLWYDTNADGIINDGDWYLAQQASYTFTGTTGKTAGLMDEESGAWTKITISGPGPDPTPEPTTGMLMLVGLAGLALRRRRA